MLILFLNRGHLHCAELRAVAEDIAYQVTLGINGASLFYDQKGQQAVGNQEKYNQYGKHDSLRERDGDWVFHHNFQHLAPRPA
jgi:hypothetical protein